MSNLQGLVGLADRNGVDISPTLLRVLTDLYVQKPVHTADEEHHFTELALRLIDKVGVHVRVAVANRLARYPLAPAAILARLARDQIEVAAPVLRHTAVLAQAELVAIAEERGADHAAAVAARPEFARLVKTPAAGNSDGDGNGDGAGAGGGDSKQDGAEEDRTARHPEPSHPAAAPPACAVQTVPAQTEPAGDAGTTPETDSLCELFLAADAQERKLILLNLDYAPIAPGRPLASAGENLLHRLEQAALLRNTDDFVRLIESGLGLSRMLARRLVEDRSGETIVVAARALDMPADMLQRIVLFLNPAVGRSVQRVYDLAKLYDEISRDAALRMLALWQDVSEQTALVAETLQSSVSRARRGFREGLRAELAPAARLASRPMRTAGGG